MRAKNRPCIFSCDMLQMRKIKKHVFAAIADKLQSAKHIQKESSLSPFCRSVLKSEGGQLFAMPFDMITRVRLFNFSQRPGRDLFSSFRLSSKLEICSICTTVKTAVIFVNSSTWFEIMMEMGIHQYFKQNSAHG